MEIMMATKRTKLNRRNKHHISQTVVDAWQRGDVRGVHRALDLAPCEYSPVPARFGGYGLPEEKPSDDRIMVAGWRGLLGWKGVKALQKELYAIAGEPGALSDAPSS
jgi:hypothetical protein